MMSSGTSCTVFCFFFVYLDNILIFSRNMSSHIEHVRQVLQFYEFHAATVSFLGFIVAEGQVRMDPAKVWAVLDWPCPTTRKEL